MTLLRLSLFVVIAWSATAAADDDAIYESMEGISIGRVFLSPQERALLDRQRHSPPQDVAAAPDAAAAPDEAVADVGPAGYIVGRSGAARYWRDGDFVESLAAPPATMAFPGDVRIIRRVESGASTPDADTESERHAAADAAATDASTEASRGTADEADAD